MQLSPHSGDVPTANTDLLALGYFQDGSGDATFKALDKALGGALKSSMKEQDFTGKLDQQLVLHTLGKLRAKRVALFGLGEKDGCGAPELFQFGGHVHRVGNKTGSKQVLMVVPDGAVKKEHTLSALARGFVLGGYRYTKYLKESGRKPSVSKVAVALTKSKLKPAEQKKALKFGQEVAGGVELARDLVNEPPLDLYPASFASRAQSVGKQCGFKVKVYKPNELENMKMGLLLGVGQGSSRTPRLVHMSYTPAGAAKSAKPIVLVGKGVTFDSGGLDIKPPANMLDMKMDMGGAAAVIGAMKAAARLKLKVPVHGLLALAENMPSGTAIRPSDVLHSANGKTVEVNNTDAEGRLVMADAIHFAQKLKPKVIIDLATLTGACMVALGPYTVGLFSNDDKVADGLLSGGGRSGEDLWRLPLTPALKKQLKSDIADTKNTGERFGGAITAALFLQGFVGKTSWAHMDIAGPAMSDMDSGAFTKGGTGVGVATLLEYISS